MTPHSMRRRALFGSALFIALGTSPSWAGVDKMRADEARGRPHPASAVWPATARPLGYTLEDMARITAAFNVGDRSGPLPNTPFQILFAGAAGPAPFRVGQGTILYVPLGYVDDGPPVIGDFPRDVENRRELLRYWYSQREFGSVQTELVVDGKVYALGARYLAGVRFTQPLPDGAKQYLVPAAFVGPLPPGPHTVEMRFKATGDALREEPISAYFPDGFWAFSLVYEVTVY